MVIASQNNWAIGMCRPKENNKRLRDGLLLKQDSENEIAQKCGEKQRPQIK